MSRRKQDLRSRILERRADSGLGVACAEAQADGVPCSTPDGDCGSCERGAAAVTAQPAPPSPALQAAAPPP